MGAILDFYRNEWAHPKGFTLEFIWSWDDSVLEKEHSYIQWLFPLTVHSQAVRNSPVITPDEIATFRSDNDLQARVVRSFMLMIRFYGLTVAEESSHAPRIAIGPGKNFASRRETWLSPDNHNYRRISRILASLVLLGLEQYAVAFYDALIGISKNEPEAIRPDNVRFWTEAVGRGVGGGGD